MTREEQIEIQAKSLVEEFAREQGVDPREVEGLAMWFKLGCAWADKHPNGSLIKWQKGEPKGNERYLVTTIHGHVATAVKVEDDLHYKQFFKEYVKAWCKLDDIEPYKEG